MTKVLLSDLYYKAGHFLFWCAIREYASILIEKDVTNQSLLKDFIFYKRQCQISAKPIGINIFLYDSLCYSLK